MFRQPSQTTDQFITMETTFLFPNGTTARYTTEEDREEDNIKIWHRLVCNDGNTLTIDWSPYQGMTKEDIQLWIDLGCPSRTGRTPLNRADLEKLQKDTALPELRYISQGVICNITAIPPRCRSSREYSRLHTLHGYIATATKEEAPVAFILSKTRPGPGIVPKSGQEIRLYFGRLFTKVTRDIKTLNQLIRHYNTCYGQQNPPPGDSHILHANTAELEENFQEELNDYLSIDGQLYTRCEEPAYKIITQGLGGDHGGTSLCVEFDPTNGCYPAGQLAAATAKAKEIAKERQDKRNIWLTPSEGFIHILIPEAARYRFRSGDIGNTHAKEKGPEKPLQLVRICISTVIAADSQKEAEEKALESLERDLRAFNFADEETRKTGGGITITTTPLSRPEDLTIVPPVWKQGCPHGGTSGKSVEEILQPSADPLAAARDRFDKALQARLQH